MPNLEINAELEDSPNTRDNMDRIRRFIDGSLFSRFDGRIIKASSSSALNIRIRHSLGFTPSDAFVTYATNGITVSINYDNFNSEYISVDVSGAGDFRLVVGRFHEV